MKNETENRPAATERLAPSASKFISLGQLPTGGELEAIADVKGHHIVRSGAIARSPAVSRAGYTMEDVANVAAPAQVLCTVDGEAITWEEVLEWPATDYLYLADKLTTHLGF